MPESSPTAAATWTYKAGRRHQCNPSPPECTPCAGDYPGPDLATPGPAFQFNDVAPTSVFRNFSGDGIGIGQNIHIKATIREFSKGELFILDPIEVTER